MKKNTCRLFALAAALALPSLGGAGGGRCLAQRHADPNAAALRGEEAWRLMADGHYYGARGLADGEEAALVADYHLNADGVAARIGRWLDAHRVHPLAARLGTMLANLRVREGRYDEALGLYAEHAGANAPREEVVEATLYRAVAHINTGDIGRARALLESIGSAGAHEADVMYYSGYVRYAEADYAGAVPYLLAVGDSRAYRKKAPVYVADCYVQQGQPARALQAIRAYQRQWGATELSLEARRVEGEALYGQGDHYNAVVALRAYADESAAPRRTALYKLGMSELHTQAYARAARDLSASAGSERDAMAQNAWLHAGMAYVQGGSKQQARMAFQQAAGMDADPAVQEKAFYNYALTLHDGATMGFGESVAAFEQFLNRYPDSPYRQSVARHLTEVYFTTSNYPAALASINKITNPSGEIVAAKQQVLYNLGVQKLAAGDNAAAKEYLRQSAATLDKPETHYWKGEAEYRLGQYAEAVADLQRSLSAPADGGDARGWRQLARYTLGYALFKQKKYADALPHFRQFADAGPADALLAADALNRLGDCQFAARDFDAATASYRQAMAASHAAGDYSLLQLALISGLRGDYRQKVELLGQLGAQYGASEYGGDALFEQGRAYVQSGDRQRAMTVFTQLMSKYPQSANCRRAANEIGMIYAESGQKEAAIAAYRRVMERYPDTEEAQTALSNLKDIYTDLGRVGEYAQLARQAGRGLTADELDEMTAEAALRATAGGDHAQALAHYRQLEAQTLSAERRMAALEGQLRSARAAGQAQAVADVVTRLLQPGAKLSPDLAAEARLARAQSHMALGNADAAVADYQQLAQDTRTAWGAQAVVELAQYAYDTKQYKSAEDILTTFTDAGSAHSYWLARAFVLLADVYAATDRAIEARQYLLSLKSSYTESEDINRMIEERLDR